MKILCKHRDGSNLFEVDFMVPPVAGDCVSRSDGTTIRQRWLVLKRVHVFEHEHEREAAPCFLILEPM